jgi:hypothetical protein
LAVKKSIPLESQVHRAAAAILNLSASERRTAIRPLVALIDRVVAQESRVPFAVDGIGPRRAVRHPCP